MAIANVKQLVEAELEGRTRQYHFVKTPAQTTTAGIWYDYTGTSGNPKAKQWFDSAPLTAVQITQSSDGGLYHGDAVSPYTKYLRSMVVGSHISAVPMPMTMILCDYLLYYPSIEDAELSEQVLTNNVTLPRYTDGAGVQAIAVTISARTGGQSFYFTYTNQDGVSGRTSKTVIQGTTSSVPGAIVTSLTANNAAANPFIGLQDNDTGIRKIDSVTMLGSDSGFFSLVLVRPLAQIHLHSIAAIHEKDFYLSSAELPVIQDNAFLSFLVLPRGSLNGIYIRGYLKTVFN